MEDGLFMLVLSLGAFFSSFVAGTIGMAGGVTLLAVLTFFFPMALLRDSTRRGRRPFGSDNWSTERQRAELVALC